MNRESQVGSRRRRLAAEGSRRLAALGRPLAEALRARAIAALPFGEEEAGANRDKLVSGARDLFSYGANTIASVLGPAYEHEPMKVARAAASVDARVHNDACVPLTHWVCDGLAELDAIAVLLGCTRLGELDAAVARALDDWQTHGGEAVQRVPRLEPAIDAVLTVLVRLCRDAASGEAALALVAPIVALAQLMRAGGAGRAASELPPSPVADAVRALNAAIHGYRAELVALGAAIDRAAGATGDRMAVALGIAARMNQVAAIAQAITGWIDRRGPTTAAQARWRRAAAAIEKVFAGSLAGVRRLVPLPP